MGMFDWVRMPTTMNCPKCGAAVSGFQTKDGKRADAEGVCGFLDTITPAEVEEGGSIMSHCDRCGEWIEYTVKDGKLEPYSHPNTPVPEEGA